MSDKQYYLLLPVERQAVIAQARAAGEVTYAVLGGSTTEDLNWIGELGGKDWDQKVVQDERGGRAVIMRVARTAT